jgi:hypothetical protein
MRKRLAIGPRPSRNTDSRSFVSYTTQLPASFAIAGGGRLIGLLNFSATGARKEGRIELGTSEQQVTFDIDGDNVLRLVVSPSKRTLRFDLNALADAAGGAQPAATATATGARRAAVEVRATGEGPAAVLIVQTFNGMRTDAGGVAVTFLSGWLVLAEGG